MARAFVKGSTVALAGPLRFADDGAPELVHPTNVTAAVAAAPDGAPAPTALGIRPRYPVVAGVGARVLERLIATAVARFAGELVDPLPTATLRRLGLPALGETVRQLHHPGGDIGDEALDRLVAGRSDAHRRLAVEDLLMVQVGLAWRREAARARAAVACDADDERVAAARAGALPFTLTGAQQRAVEEIDRELARAVPMQRLLVGDVGSGKTAVAFAAAVRVALSGGQTLLMAPTEVLAEQHARTLGALGQRAGLRVGLLTASTPRPQREALLALTAAGKVHLLVGTQALLGGSVVLPDLRLAVVDEQHRFGVAQRARLSRRDSVVAAEPLRGDGDYGDASPHLLVMTATPIPRTLAMTLYGDLDLTVLDELPPGRTPVATRILSGPTGRRAAVERLRAVVDRGEAAFVVCHVREDATREGAVTAVARHQELSRLLAPARVGLIHGAMPPREKDGALRAFATGDTDVLVATTVVEVGVDVPRATLMVIEEADRFGLAQLHQLRGRVGRGAVPAECLLLTGGASAGVTAEGRARLRALAGTHDGFQIAEADLAQRGCGELFGARQSGVPRLRFADMAEYTRLLDEAREEARRILADDPHLEAPAYAPLRQAVRARWDAARVFAEEAG